MLRAEASKGRSVLRSRPEEAACYHTHTYMRVQIDRFEDGGWAVLVFSHDVRRIFEVPRELLPDGVSAGDVFEVRFELDAEETERLAEENRRLLGGLIRREKP
jgi:hypothetical protein